MDTILLTEDDQSIAMGLIYSLTQENFTVLHCKTVEESLQALTDTTVALAILDITLPDGNGYDICRKIRETSDIPVIFLTACDEEVNVVMGLDMGADDYITKPFRIRELISRIKTVLRRYHQHEHRGAVLE
ncbi:MAG: response regulator transcription factor, partial [Clostridia bacterium]